MIVLHVMTGDVFHLPEGVRWGLPPGWGLSRPDQETPAYMLGFTTTISKQPLYVWVASGRSGYVQVDDRTYRAEADGDTILSVFDRLGDVSPLVDHTSAINRFGHLLIDPNPVSKTAVVEYNTGEGLDVSAARSVGAMPGLHLRTTCDSNRCSLLVLGDDRAPVTGTVECDATVELVADGFRLAFEPDGIPPGQATPAYAPPCTPQEQVAAGTPIPMPYAPMYARAYSPDGQPLSIVVAGDGTLYVGNIVPKFSCGPCRGR
jgi:hypothetical protein